MIDAQAKALNRLGLAATSGFKSMGFGLIVWNQALDLGRKLLEMWRLTLGGAISKALEFRKMGDGTRETLDKFKDTLNVTIARLGDAFLPVLLGVADAMTPVIKSLADWLTANHKLLATNIADWAFKLAQILTKGIAKGVLLVAKIWGGWKLVIEGTQLVVNKFFSFVLQGFEKVIQTAAKVAEALGFEEQAEGMRRFARGVGNLRSEFDAAADEAVLGMQREVDSLNDLEKKVNEIEGIALKKLGDTWVAVNKRVQDSTVGVTQTIEDQKKALEEREKREAAAAALAAKMADERRAQTEERLAQIGSIAQANAALFQAWIEGTATAADVWKGMLNNALDVLQEYIIRSITAKAADAAAGSASAVAPTPFIGPALAAAIIPVTFSLVKGLINQAFADGGLVRSAGGIGAVRGGTPGRDSVVGLLQPGELVLPTRVVQDIARLMGTSPPTARPAFANGGMVPAGGGGSALPSVTVNLTGDFRGHSPAELRTAMREEMKAVFVDLKRQGHMKGARR